MKRLWYRLTYRRVQVDVDFGNQTNRRDLMDDGTYSGHTGLRTFMWVRRWEGLRPKNYVYSDQYRVAGGQWESRSYRATQIRGRFNRLHGLYVRVPAPDGVTVSHLLEMIEPYYVDDQAVTPDE